MSKENTCATRIKFISKLKDSTEHVLSAYDGNQSIRKEKVVYLKSENGTHTKYNVMNSAFRIDATGAELVIVVEPYKQPFLKRFTSFLTGLREDTLINIYILIGIIFVLSILSVHYWGYVMLGFLVQYSGVFAALASIVYLMLRAPSDLPPLIGGVLSALIGFALMAAIYWWADFSLDPEKTIFVTPKEELGQLVVNRVLGLPTILVSYSATMLVVLRTIGFAFAADLFESIRADREGDTS